MVRIGMMMPGSNIQAAKTMNPIKTSLSKEASNTRRKENGIELPKRSVSMPATKNKGKWTSIIEIVVCSFKDDSFVDTDNVNKINHGSSSSTTKKMEKIHHRVRFCEVVRMLEYPALRLTQVEKMSLWYDKWEYEMMQLDIMKSIRKIEDGKVLRDKKYSQTGIECWTEKGSLKRYEAKMMGWTVVFEEQDNGWTYHRRPSHTSWKISTAYKRASQSAKELAIQTAARIRDDVNRYHTQIVS